jgi:tRNA (guanine-N7-)-methyltransferase
VDQERPPPAETPKRRPSPYADAPRLPEGESVDLASLVSGEWIEIEVGCGRGAFVLERAAAEPRAAVVGMEIKRKWAALVDARLARQGLAGRARVFAEDARAALPRLGPAGALKRMYMHFPDPWWKKRHHKRMVMGDVFLDEAARLLEPGGELFIQTDVAERAEAYAARIATHPAFAPAGDRDGSPDLQNNPYSARSNRERRADEDGLPVHRMRWVRVRA